MKDKCPCCDTEYEWDACQDCWVKTTEIVYAPEGGRKEMDDREVVVCVCPRCDAVVGIIVTAESQHGSGVFVPCTKPL